MIDAVIHVRLSGELLDSVLKEAKRCGMSVERWFISLVEDRLRDQQVAERFFDRRNAAGRTMREILNSMNDHPPMPGDELEL